MNCKQTIQHRKKYMDAYKLSNGCCVCGYNRHPSALCFDHLPGVEKAEATKNGCSKRTCAGGMFRLYDKKYSVDILLSEIKKCRVLCHNCHMEETYSKININQNDINPITIESLEFNLKNHE